MEMNKVFKDGLWSKEINVSDFVHTNITPYEAMPHFWPALQREQRKCGTSALKRWKKNAPTMASVLLIT